MQTQALDISALYLSQRLRLQRIIRRLVGNGEAAEDLVHQSFEKLLAALDAKDIQNRPAYLTSTARNLALNHLRDIGRRGEVELGDEQFHAVPDSRPSPELVVLHRSELRRVMEAIAALPPRRREVFVLHKFEGLNYDEIADRKGISRNTVISHIVLALADLDRHFVR